MPEVYIWRTRSDGRVSDEHAANNGKVFTRDNPPPTGHPGQGYGCRCVAEAVNNPRNSSWLDRTIRHIRKALSAKPKWQDAHLSLHFFVVEGRSVGLKSIGLYDEVRRQYESDYLGAFISQIENKAKTQPDGYLADTFNATYDFLPTLTALGHANMTGKFQGEVVSVSDGQRFLIGEASFEFYDRFKDPLSVAEIYSDARNLIAGDFSEADLSETFKEIANLGGTPFDITGGWEMKDVQLVLSV